MKKEIPEVEVVKSERLNISVWFVPIVAILISLWLVYRYFSQLGPEITIEFPASYGLKAKQSQIKFRDVPIGVVTKISLKPGGKGVIVTATINKDAKQFLNTTTRFWIVKPRIDKTGITGLETLVSGSYIEIYAEANGSYRDKFVGSKEPYLDEENIQGKYFKLISTKSYDLEVGSLVYCKNIVVGEVKQVKLSQDGSYVEFDVFVQDPYHKLINQDTKFWNMSKFQTSFSGGKLDFFVASTSQLIYGAIAFNPPTKKIKPNPLTKQHYRLFGSFEETQFDKMDPFSGNIRSYQMYFNQAADKLKIGAPVKFFGFKIGEVVNIESWFDSKDQNIKSIVLADLDLSLFGSDQNVSLKNFQNLLSNGLQAELVEQNLLFDSFYIELKSTKTPQKIVQAKPYDILPTKPIKSTKIKEQIDKLLKSLTMLLNTNTKPLHDILTNLNTVIINLNSIVSQNELNQLPKQLNTSLIELQNTLKSTQAMIKNTTKMEDDIKKAVQDISKASKALQRVLYKIDKKPNSLIFGD